MDAKSLKSQNQFFRAVKPNFRESNRFCRFYILFCVINKSAFIRL